MSLTSYRTAPSRVRPFQKMVMNEGLVISRMLILLIDPATTYSPVP